MMAGSSMSCLDDAREVLKEVDRRKSNLNYNLMLLERERILNDTKTLLKIMLTEGYDSEKLRARRLVDQLIESSKVTVQGFVDRGFAEAMQKKTENNTSPNTHRVNKPKSCKRPVVNSRLFEAKPKACLRCQKKIQESDRKSELPNNLPRVVNKGKYQTPLSRRCLPNDRSLSSLPSIKGPVDRNVSIPHVEEKPLYVPPVQVVPRFSTQSILTTRALKKQPKSPVEKRNVIVPLGLYQENKVAKSSKETNTDQPSISVQSLKHTESHTKPKSFSIQVLPSINIESVEVAPQTTSPVNIHYVEFQEKNEHLPVLASHRSIQVPDCDIGSNPEIERNNDTSPKGADAPSPLDPHSKINDHVNLLQTKNDAIERKLVRYVMEKLASMENARLHDLEPDGNGSRYVNEFQTLQNDEEANGFVSGTRKLGDVYSEVGAVGILADHSRRHILNKSTSPSSDDKLSEELVPTPIPTPTTSSPCPSPDRVPVTPSLSPESETLSSQSLEENLRISTPHPSSTPQQQESLAGIVTPAISSSLETKNEEEEPVDQTSQHRVTLAGDHSCDSVTREKRPQSQMSDEPAAESGLKTLDDRSLGQVPSMQTKRKELSVSPESMSDETDVHSETDHDLMNMTSSTTLSEGEVKAYWLQLGPSGRIVTVFGSRLSGHNANWPKAVHSHGTVVLRRDKTASHSISARPDADNSEMSIGEVQVSPSSPGTKGVVTKDKHRIVIEQDFSVRPPNWSQDSLSEGEVLSKD